VLLQWHECITVVLCVAHGVWAMLLLSGMVTGWLSWFPLVFAAWQIVVMIIDRDEQKPSESPPASDAACG
jgi:hypothetical protein